MTNSPKLRVDHKKPCGECPFRINSLPGWLGASNPTEFARAIQTEVHLPCHTQVDYEDPEWRSNLTDKPFCAGSMQFMRNIGKLPRDPLLARARNQYESNPAVFKTIPDFINHHEKRLTGTKRKAI